MFESLFDAFDTGLFEQFRRLESEMGELFGHAPWASGIRANPQASFPPLNVGATPERVDVYLFAAGLDPKALDLSIQQNLLTISGARRVEANKNAEYYRHERFDGDFRRLVTLPDDIDAERVEAKYRDGVLQITIQRRESARPRQITVS
jgi:HSP20 family protein